MDAREFSELLQRYERLAYRAAKGEDSERQLGATQDRLARASRDLSALQSDFKAAEAKIAEWAEYATKLRAMLKTRKVPDMKLPTAPGPLESEIPF